MIKLFKIFEIFESENFYPYFLISKINKKDDNGIYTLFTYKFTTKDNLNYYIRVWFYFKPKELRKYYKNFLTIDFLEEKQYEKNVDIEDNINYENINKYDAIKVLNTVFTVLKEMKEKNNPWIISFDCTSDRFEIYKYAVYKFLPGYIYVNFYDEENKKEFFYLYNPDFYISDENNIIRKDNKKIVWSEND